MRLRWYGSLVLGAVVQLVLSGNGAFAAATGSPPTPAPTPTPLGTPQAALSPKAVTTALPADQVRALRARFSKAQSIELYALEHRQQAELKELIASQKVRRQEWEAREKQLRHEMYAKNVPSKEMGQFIRDFVQRRKLFLKSLTDEKETRTREYSVRSKSMRQHQTEARKEFESYLSKGQIPPVTVWPESNP